jgi:hypothetical protein
MADLQAMAELNGLIGAGERVLWAGKPAQGTQFHRSDWVFIPFAILWAAFVVFWEITVINTGAPGYFALIGIPLILIGIFMVAGRFFWDAKVRGGQRYVLTDRHVIIDSTYAGRWTKRFELAKLPPMTVTEYASGKGSITFKDTSFRVFSGKPNALEFISPAQQGDRFDLIQDVRKVEQMILEAKKKAAA